MCVILSWNACISNKTIYLWVAFFLKIFIQVLFLEYISCGISIFLYFIFLHIIYDFFSWFHKLCLEYSLLGFFNPFLDFLLDTKQSEQIILLHLMFMMS
jgi:hypothetical protein